MDARLTIKKCAFCCKNFNMLQLIEMNANTVLIHDEEVNYSDLIFDITSTKMDTNVSNYICTECSNNALSFHCFKRDTKKYGSLRYHLKKLEILYEVERFLDTVEELDDLHIAQDCTSLAINLESPKRPIVKDENVKEDITELDNETEYTEIDIKYIYEEEQVEEPVNEIIYIDTSDEVELQKVPEENEEENLIKGEYAVTSESKKPRSIEVKKVKSMAAESSEEAQTAKKRKFNTLNDLTEEQISLVREKVAAGQSMQGNKKNFTCTVCQCLLATQASLIRHLRDVHILKRDSDDGTLLKQEVANSEIMVETSGGCETVWMCRRCDKNRVYKSVQAFKLHIRMTHIRTTKVDTAFVAECKTTIKEGEALRSVWKCPDCGRIFRHRDTLRNHIKSEHPDMNEEDVKRRFEEEKRSAASESYSNETISNIVQKLEHKQIGKSSNFCNECGLVFATATHYSKPKIHRESHEIFKSLSPNLPRNKCESCRMIFNSETHLDEHIATHGDGNTASFLPAEGLSQFGAKYYKVPTGDADDATDEVVWRCAHCTVRYFDENDCVVHVMLLHTSPLYCFIDNREFSGSSGMSKYMTHMKNKHSDLFPDLTYPCGSCKAPFESIYEKLAHQKVCINKKFECDYCGKRYFSKHQLQAHILYELGLTGFSCDTCDKVCKTFSDLKIHMNVHSQARPYECSLCPKTFKTPAARSTHVEGHTAEGLTCEICSQKLANRILYQRHKRFQHNQTFRESQMEKNKCSTCGKSFLRLTHYKEHLKLRHGI